jgi:uncharacterized protein (DUF697 family)
LRRIGIVLIVIGAVVLLASLTADIMGLTGDTGFQVGPRQAGGITLGLVVMVVGFVFTRRNRAS